MRLNKITTILIAFFLFAPVFASASIVAQQPDDSVAIATSTAYGPIHVGTQVCLGTGLSGAFNTMRMYFSNTGGTSGVLHERIDEITGSTCSGSLLHEYEATTTISAGAAHGSYDFFSANMSDCTWNGSGCSSITYGAGFSFNPTSSYLILSGPMNNGITGTNLPQQYGSSILGEDAAYIISVGAPIPPPSSGLTMTAPTATTYTNNPITFSGRYNNLDFFNQVRFVLTNTTLGVSVNMAPLSLPASQVVNGAWSVTRSLPFDGNYTVKAYLYDTYDATSTAYTSTIIFGLGTTTTTSTTTQANLPGSPLPIDCGTFDIGCYIKNAMVWLFYPTQASTDQFSQLSLQSTFPFSYAYDTVDAVGELFNTSATASSTISVTVPWLNHTTTTFTFLSAALLSAVPFSGLIRTIISYLLWLGLAVYLYRSILKSHDDVNTTV